VRSLVRRLHVVAVVALCASVVLPLRAAESAISPRGLGVRLEDAPTALRADPRAHVYVIDHVAPGASFTRHMVVNNDTGGPATISLYADAASIKDGTFLPAAGRSANELTRWITVQPASMTLAQGEEREAAMTFRVPNDASTGERYAVVYAELPSTAGGGFQVAARAGIRVYLDVGLGAAPASDFSITSLTAERDSGGSPVVKAAVKNTGGRALDMSGQLWLKNGPGGLSAGPFPAQLGTTLGIGQEEPVTVKLDKRLPAGPWLAHLELQSDLIKHAAEATITFPTQAGTVGKTVKAKAVPLTKNKQVLGIVAGSIIGLVLVGILIFLFLLWKRRGDDEDDDKRRSGPPNIPQSRAKESLRDRVRR